MMISFCNYQKKHQFENNEENAPSFNISHQSDSYIEIDSNEEKEKINEKETEALEEAKNNENINQNNNEENTTEELLKGTNVHLRWAILEGCGEHCGALASQEKKERKS